MSKKRFLSIVLSAVMISSLACSALAVGQSGRYMLGDEKPYATFGTGRHFVTRPATAGMTGSVKIGDFKLSSDINKVIVKSSSLQAYNLTKATWQSSIEFSGMVWVK